VTASVGLGAFGLTPYLALTSYDQVFPCVAVRCNTCSALQCATHAVYWSAMQCDIACCDVVCCGVLQGALSGSHLLRPGISTCCSALQQKKCVAACNTCSMLQCDAVRRSVFRISVLRCVAVCCTVLYLALTSYDQVSQCVALRCNTGLQQMQCVAVRCCVM